MIIGFVGIEGSGKSTATAYLSEKYGCLTDSFASAVKDVCASVFGWDRSMLEGIDPESRQWREEVDLWWSSRLSIPDFSPRVAMRIVGTSLFRNTLHQDIWILSLQHRLDKMASTGKPVIITDLRFANEIRFVQNIGRVFLIDRMEDPEWLLYAKGLTNVDDMHTLMPHVHQSNWDWLKVPNLAVIPNNSSLAEFNERLENIFKKLL